MSVIEVTEFRIPLPEGAWVRNGVTTKKEALMVECPTCMVVPGSPCVDPVNRRPRRRLHIGRHSLSIERGARVRYIGGARVYYDDERADDSEAA